MSQGTAAKSPSAPELSLDEWFALPEDEPGELVDGRLEQEEVADYLHELLVALLIRILTLDLDALWAAIDNLE